MLRSNITKIIFLSSFLFMFMAGSAWAQCHEKKSSWSASKTSMRVSDSHERDIVSLALGKSYLSTLVAAVKAAGLVETLQGKGPFTVFAPTNTAFAALPEGTVASLLKPENKDQLIKILTYHVVPGRIESTDLSTGAVQSVEGSDINVELNGEAVKINNALVTKANIRATNGVIHVIDRVILPE